MQWKKNEKKKKERKKNTYKWEIQEKHGAIKSYVCSQCPKCFYTVHELKRHQLVHSDYKQFCCGLCGTDFKLKHYVLRHYKKCSAKV